METGGIEKRERACTQAGHASLEERRSVQSWPDWRVIQADDDLEETRCLKWSWMRMGALSFIPGEQLLLF